MTGPALPTRYDDAGASPGFVLWRVASLWQRAVREALVAVDLTHAQFVVLASAAWLGDREDAVTQVRIADHARIDPVMTSEVLRTLERKALVRRLPHPSDARARRIELTDAGRALVARAVALVEAVDEAFFRDRGPELQALAAILR